MLVQDANFRADVSPHSGTELADIENATAMSGGDQLKRVKVKAGEGCCDRNIASLRFKAENINSGIIHLINSILPVFKRDAT